MSIALCRMRSRGLCWFTEMFSNGDDDVAVTPDSIKRQQHHCTVIYALSSSRQPLLCIDFRFCSFFSSPSQRFDVLADVEEASVHPPRVCLYLATMLLPLDALQYLIMPCCVASYFSILSRQSITRCPEQFHAEGTHCHSRDFSV
jgi:hypothetical protein